MQNANAMQCERTIVDHIGQTVAAMELQVGTPVEIDGRYVCDKIRGDNFRD
jgi:hypothetical protein